MSVTLPNDRIVTTTDRTVTTLNKIVAELSKGETRPGQEKMARIVSRTLKTNSHAVVQAGTGTGKSLAYLVPAIMSKKRIVIATATKALQDQLAHRDLPFLRKHLDFDFAVLKGRSNYLCLQKLNEVSESYTLNLGIRANNLTTPEIKSLNAFAANTSSGDRTDYKEPLTAQAWSDVSATSTECPGADDCAYGEECFAEQAKSAARRATITVINLHLYAMSIKYPILDTYDAIIIDEAHQLEDIVSQVFTTTITPKRLTNFAARYRSLLPKENLVLNNMKEAAQDIRDAMLPLIGETEVNTNHNLLEALLMGSIRVQTVAAELQRASLANTDKQKEATERAVRVAQQLAGDLHNAAMPHTTNANWVAGNKTNPELHSMPVDIGPILQNDWLRSAAILTSATLPESASKRLGLPRDALYKDVGSPFDYENNTLLYCPKNAPDPRDPSSQSKRYDDLETLMEVAGGRTLALFTSYTSMQGAAERIRKTFPHPILVQGDDTNKALQERFAAEEHTSLFATLSFWQGIDVPGPSCSVVVIDKLPFPRPDDPIMSARRKAAGKYAFRSVDIPKTSVALAQGVGRLIRTADDAGVVAILDSRFATANYRGLIWKCLPSMPQTSDIDEAIEFLEYLDL